MLLKIFSYSPETQAPPDPKPLPAEPSNRSPQQGAQYLESRCQMGVGRQLLQVLPSRQGISFNGSVLSIFSPQAGSTHVP